MTLTAGAPANNGEVLLYGARFGLHKDPFRGTPDKHFFFASPDYRGAALELQAAMTVADGVCLLSGPAGCGKTLLLHYALDALDGQVPRALIWNANLGYEDLLISICARLGAQQAQQRGVDASRVLQSLAADSVSAGFTPVVVVDEAHHLPDAVLERLDELCALQVDGRQALSIVLAAESRGVERIRSALGNGTLRRRLTVHRLDRSAVDRYVQHRLQVAGAEQPIFDERALQRIHVLSEGVPRVINLLAGKALFMADLADRDLVSVELIDEVAGELWGSGVGNVHVFPPGAATTTPVREVADTVEVAPHLEASEPMLYPAPESASPVPGATPLDSGQDRAAGITDPVDSGRWLTGTVAVVLLILGMLLAALLLTPQGRLWLQAEGVGFLVPGGVRSPAPDVPAKTPAPPSQTSTTPRLQGSRAPQPVDGGTMAGEDGAPELMLRAQIRALLQSAVIHVNVQRLVTPPGYNAWEDYRRVLDLEPGHPAAVQGIRAIQLRLTRWARTAERRGDWAAAAAYYRKALQVAPDSAELAEAWQRASAELLESGGSGTP